MKFKEYLAELKNKEVIEVCKLLVGLLRDEYGLKFEQIRELDEKTLLKQYTITGELDHPDPENNEINFLLESKKLLSMTPEEMRNSGAFEVKELFKKSPGRQGYAFFRDCKKILRKKDKEAYHKIDSKQAAIIKNEKVKDTEESRLTKRLSQFSETVKKYSLAVVGGALANSYFLGQGKVDPRVIGPALLLTCGSKLLKYYSEVRDRAMVHNKIISQALCDSAMISINKSNSLEPEKHLYLKAKSVRNLQKKILDIKEEKENFKDIQNIYMPR